MRKSLLMRSLWAASMKKREKIPIFDSESDFPACQHSIVEPQQGETVADRHLRFDVASRVSDSGAFRMDERGPHLNLTWSRDEGRKRLDLREPWGLELRRGRSRGQKDQASKAQPRPDQRRSATKPTIRMNQEPPPPVRRPCLRLAA